MSQVLSTEVVEDSPQADGRRYVRYRYVIEDDTGATVTREVGPRLVPSTFNAQQDATDRAPQILADEQERDAQQWLQDIQSGANPFETRPRRFGDRTYYLKTCLDWGLSVLGTEPDIPVVMRGVALVDKVTDAELKALYGWTQAEVDAIRADAEALKAARQTVMGYTPPLGGE